MITAFLLKNPIYPHPPPRPKTQFLKILFINQSQGLLIISNILRDHRVTSKIPQYFENLDPPSSLLSVQKTIRNIIFNYNQVISDPDVRSSIQCSCSCADSPFLHSPAGRVVTGDRTCTCIPDKGLRLLFERA